MDVYIMINNYIFQSAEDISNIQEKRIDKMYQIGLNVQPYIIVVGPTLADISSFFVSIDKVLYNVTSVLKAIDTCFKIFHVFNVQYPAASDHIWILMQRKLYKFITKYDKTPPYILEIINVLWPLVITHTNDHIRTCRVLSGSAIKYGNVKIS